MLAVLISFSTSCSNEKTEELGGEAMVSFELNVQNQMLTKSGGGAGVDVLAYSLFDANGNLIAEIGNSGLAKKENAFAAGMSENVSISLTKGKTYTIVFWAQNSLCKAYTLTAGDKGLNVDVDYKGVNNDETRDAFYASETFTVEENAAVEVVLSRPFAQINLGVTEEDWNAAVTSGINITQSKVVIKNVAKSINLLDGSVSGEENVEYELANIPTTGTRAASNVKDLEVDSVSYKWLSMSYILTGEKKTTLDSDGLQFVLVADNGENIVLDEGLHNVPVQRNWRTNIVGSVLTSNVDFKVTIDQEYYSIANVTNVAEFKEALADKNIKVIKLAAGEYDGMFIHNKTSKTIESANPETPATIKGKVAVSAPVVFNNIHFDVSDYSTQSTGHQYIDRYERKAIVPIYAVAAEFYGCSFVNLYDSREVVAINYYCHKVGTKLIVDNCYFQGYAYTIYSRALVSVTNSTFDQYHTQVNPRAIFLYGLGDDTPGEVIFKGNKATNTKKQQPSYALQMMSTIFHYRNIKFDVQGNENFVVEGTPYLYNSELDFSNRSFVDGSYEF